MHFLSQYFLLRKCRLLSNTPSFQTLRCIRLPHARQYFVSSGFLGIGIVVSSNLLYERHVLRSSQCECNLLLHESALARRSGRAVALGVRVLAPPLTFKT